jgi:hypothetical protein
MSSQDGSADDKRQNRLSNNGEAHERQKRTHRSSDKPQKQPDSFTPHQTTDSDGCFTSKSRLLHTEEIRTSSSARCSECTRSMTILHGGCPWLPPLAMMEQLATSTIIPITSLGLPMI